MMHITDTSTHKNTQKFSQDFYRLLGELSTVSVAINKKIEEDGDQVINTTIFGEKFCGDVLAYKEKYFRKLRSKERKIQKIEVDIYQTSLGDTEKTVLLSEVKYRLLRIEFLRYTYDTEAQKIDPEIQTHFQDSIEVYNDAFFGVTQDDLIGQHDLGERQAFPSIYPKSTLKKLICASKKLCPDMKFSFGDHPNYSHRGGVIYIPDQEYYNLQNIITIFFHEATHFFRTYNGKRNLGFAHQFAGYLRVEEGMAIYNEYLYGNKICDYGVFTPYYKMCLQVLRSDLSEKEKKRKICEILAHKGFDKKRSLKYYHRFYKFCAVGSKHIWLKDLIYYKGYGLVRELIAASPDAYDRLMAGDIGPRELEQRVVSPAHNYDYQGYFEEMVDTIKKISSH